MSKFDTCVFRSEEEEDLTKESCCGKKSKKQRGYICWHLQIAPLNEDTCRKCDFYKNKEEKETLNGNPFG